MAVAAADTGHSHRICELGFTYFDAPFRRAWASPLAELKALVRLARVCRKCRPSLVHFITVKPIVLGRVACLCCRPCLVVNALTGLGVAFTGGFKAGVTRRILTPFLKLALRNPAGFTVLQNPDDLELLVERRMIERSRALVIRGSGVDCERFRPSASFHGQPLVLLASRMLRDKGVPEFVRMARSLKKSHPEVRFVLAGDVDKGNPRSLRTEELEGWAKEGVVEWWGFRDDLPDVLAGASIFVLPTTYREGVPLVLLEAAASGVPIVTTDAPGCREIVRHDVNGFLVQPGDDGALIESVVRLLASAELRERFGRAGREIAVSEFRVEHVVEQTMQLYDRLLEERS